jgi:hypothetical protein
MTGCTVLWRSGGYKGVIRYRRRRKRKRGEKKEKNKDRVRTWKKSGRIKRRNGEA